MSTALYLHTLRRIVGDTTSKHLLDLCCGEATHTRQLVFASHTGIDVLDCPLRPAYIVFEQTDVLMWRGPQRVFDVVLLSDALEHFAKPAGIALLERMRSWATQRIVFAPIGPHRVNESATDPHTHKSAWVPSELDELGWHTEAHPTWHPTLGIGAFFAWSP